MLGSQAWKSEECLSYCKKTVHYFTVPNLKP